MSFIDYFKAAFELAKKAQSVELQSELLAMREDYNTLQEHNLALRERVKALEEQQSLAADLEYHAPAYYLKSDTARANPYCQRCWDVDRRLVRVSIRRLPNSSAVAASCTQCSIEFSRGRQR